jgi:H+/Cl- antiporter ClcA
MLDSLFEVLGPDAIPFIDLVMYFFAGCFAGMVGHYYRMYMKGESFKFWRENITGAIVKGLMGGMFALVVDTALQYAILTGLFIDTFYENGPKIRKALLSRTSDDDDAE